MSSIVHRLWPVTINLWIGAVIVLFLLLRVLDSQTAQRLLRWFEAR